MEDMRVRKVLSSCHVSTLVSRINVYRKKEGEEKKEKRLTLIAKNRVSAMEVKYAAVKGNRGPAKRCFRYVNGPIRTAHDAKNKTEPMDHLYIRYDMLLASKHWHLVEHSKRRHRSTVKVKQFMSQWRNIGPWGCWGSQGWLKPHHTPSI